MTTVAHWLRSLPWGYLLPITLVLGLAPFRPQPHLLQKLQMLSAGDLVRPVDIFDLVLHAAPLLLVVGKLLTARQEFNGERES